MKVTPLELPEVLLVEPDVYGDERGFFLETYSKERYQNAGMKLAFVQDNLSRSRRGILRGLHLQHPYGQGKLVSVVEGEVFDVAVDVRVDSSTFGKWVGYTLSSANRHQLYVPPGFAHGFCVTSEFALFAYKCTDGYHPEAELGVVWNDPAIGIKWPVDEPTLSEKDARHPLLKDIPKEALPRYFS